MNQNTFALFVEATQNLVENVKAPFIWCLSDCTRLFKQVFHKVKE